MTVAAAAKALLNAVWDGTPERGASTPAAFNEATRLFAELVADDRSGQNETDGHGRDAPVALNIDQLLSGIDADPRYARAASVLTAMVAFFSGADAEAPVAILRDRARQAEEFRDWIEDAKPRVTA